MTNSPVAFAPDEIRTGEPTRAARLKWVIVVDEALPAGRAVNASVCVAAATAGSVGGLLGPDATDAASLAHPGLPWAGCSILGADRDTLGRLLGSAHAMDDVHVSVMPEAAQTTRVYDEYLEAVATLPTAGLTPLAVSIVGPRNRVDKLVKRLSLLG
jgi:hypothetical protein